MVVQAAPANPLISPPCLKLSPLSAPSPLFVALSSFVHTVGRPFFSLLASQLSLSRPVSYEIPLSLWLFIMPRLLPLLRPSHSRYPTSLSRFCLALRVSLRLCSLSLSCTFSLFQCPSCRHAVALCLPGLLGWCTGFLHTGTEQELAGRYTKPARLFPLSATHAHTAACADATQAEWSTHYDASNDVG